MSQRRIGILILLFPLLLANTTQDNPPSTMIEGCDGKIPLYSKSWDAISLESLPTWMGEWQLPVSGDRPDLVTQGRVEFEIIQEKGSLQAIFNITFDDPKPYGLPFSFWVVSVDWDDASGHQSFHEDWSHGCQTVGKTLYPGHKWSFVLDLGKSLPTGPVSHFQVQLWGSRN